MWFVSYASGLVFEANLFTSFCHVDEIINLYVKFYAMSIFFFDEKRKKKRAVFVELTGSPSHIHLRRKISLCRSCYQKISRASILPCTTYTHLFCYR